MLQEGCRICFCYCLLIFLYSYRLSPSEMQRHRDRSAGADEDAEQEAAEAEPSEQVEPAFPIAEEGAQQPAGTRRSRSPNKMPEAKAARTSGSAQGQKVVAAAKARTWAERESDMTPEMLERFGRQPVHLQVAFADVMRDMEAEPTAAQAEPMAAEAQPGAEQGAEPGAYPGAEPDIPEGAVAAGKTIIGQHQAIVRLSSYKKKHMCICIIICILYIHIKKLFQVIRRLYMAIRRSYLERIRGSNYCNYPRWLSLIPTAPSVVLCRLCRTGGFAGLSSSSSLRMEARSTLRTILGTRETGGSTRLSS